DREGEVYPFSFAVLEKRVIPISELRLPCGPLRWMLRGDESFNPLRDAARIAAKDIDLHTLFEQDDPRSPIRRVELGKPLVDRAGATFEITHPGLTGNLRKHGVDEGMLICAPLPARDDIDGDFHSVAKFRDRLIKVEHFVRLQPLGERDDRLPFKADLPGASKEALS